MATNLPTANATLLDHQAIILDKFCDLPAKTRRQICHMHASVICDVFPTGIEKIKPNAKKPKLDKIMAKTKLAFAKIQEDQAHHKLKKEKNDRSRAPIAI